MVDQRSDLRRLQAEGAVAGAPGSEGEVRAALTKADLSLATFQIGQRFESGQSFVLTFEGEDAVVAWRKARSVLPSVGYWPVISEAGRDPKQVCELDLSKETSAELLERGKKLAPEAWLAARPKEDPEYFVVEKGKWPVTPSRMTSFTIPFDVLSKKPLKTWLVLFPTSRSWEVPGLCKYGDYNICPSASVHVAMMKYWNEAYGAELVGMSGDTVEMIVSRPPTTRDQARKLAHEQFLYCPDIVLQGVGDLEPLAAALLDASIWFFWWD